MKKNFVVTTQLPHAGLGNMLLVWARAVVFAELNSLPMIAPKWNAFHLGPWLRGERIKRYYGSLFSTKNYQSKFENTIANLTAQKYIHLNPDLKKLDLDSVQFQAPGQHIFMFDQMPPWNDYFQDVKYHQPLLKQKLYGDINPKVYDEIFNRPIPQIGIHIRRGDYKPPQAGDDFAVKRCVYTPLDWYIDSLQTIRHISGTNIPATIFSDAYPEELAQILALPNVSMSSETSALSDMIALSRSKLIIGSCHSSFSAWAAYLGQSPILWQVNRANLYEPIYVNEFQNQIYEGGFDPSVDLIPDLLVKNIHTLFPLSMANHRS